MTDHLPTSSKVTAVALAGAVMTVLSAVGVAFDVDVPVSEPVLVAAFTAVMTIVGYLKAEYRPSPSAIEMVLKSERSRG